MRLTASRTRRGDLSTAVHEWVHPDTGHNIVVVGTIHIGEAVYYQALREYVESFDASGFAVHYELITPAGPEAMATATLAERRQLVHMRQLGQAMRELGVQAALPTQHVWFPLPAHWRNVDVTDLDTVRAHRGYRFIETLAVEARRVEQLKAKPGVSPEEAEAIRRMLRFMLRHIDVVRAFTAPMRWARPTMNTGFILGHRNALAVEAAVTETRDVVTVWGADHLPGIGRELGKRGYHLSRRTWFTAIAKHPRDLVGEK